ncbi:hypothetical protein SAMN05428642_101571 [Flaviramulus basaltis]|uniref:Por secretion system C-terminal sorting domain-containing protein n=1 Tax=Flaviramulus basaltis TaxID=369401 RepID=A0A1K2IDM9_9FLAO|nr:hypothetical protein [Flaviramulus basaltis]SFZ89803.1 hypothetical protein SAMN05428642_101571 [Flaviramulus basaltis]
MTFSIIILQCILAFSLKAQVNNKLGAVSSYRSIGDEIESKTQQNKESYHYKSTSKTSSKPIVRRTNGSIFQTIRLEFNGIQGSLVKRELLLGFSEDTTDDYDYGYDAQVNEAYENDLHLDLKGMNMSIQAYAALVPEKIVQLKHNSSGENTFSIKITELENIDESQPIFLRDKITGSYFDLSTGEAYQFMSDKGSFNDRFELAFQPETSVGAKSLSTNDAQYDMKYVYYQAKTKKFHAKQLKSMVKKLVLLNMHGQKILEYNNLSKDTLEAGISFNNLVANAYAVLIHTDKNLVLTKKILVN